MANNNKEITSQDVLDLVVAKAQDPHISMEDIFKKVNSVKPNYNKEMWHLLWIPLVFFLASIIGMLFISQNTPWFRLSVIVFGMASIVGCMILYNYDKKWWLVFPLDMFILYVVFSESLSFKELVGLIKESIQ